MKPADAPLSVRSAALVVRDLEGVRAHYTAVLGLEEIAGDAGSSTLGAGGTPLMSLHRDAHARPPSARSAGLFHIAFILPSRGDLGRWARHAQESGVAIEGAADHAVSEAIYLSDPEGNGIEVYADRPYDEWRWRDGNVVMVNEPLDGAALMASGGDGRWRGMPHSSGIGHVHLRVGEIDAADAFYRTVLGLDLAARTRGASFYSAGGYHHHLGANVWSSLGAPVRADGVSGLERVDLRVAGAAQADAILARAAAAGRPATVDGDGLIVLRDPWGTRLTLSVG